MTDSEYSSAADAVANFVRRVPGFPSKGVVFEDLTPVLADAGAFRLIVDELAEAARSYHADIIGGAGRSGIPFGFCCGVPTGPGNPRGSQGR